MSETLPHASEDMIAAAADGCRTREGVAIAVCPIDWLTLCFVPDGLDGKLRIVRGLAFDVVVQEWHDASTAHGIGQWVNYTGTHPMEDVNAVVLAVRSMSDDLFLSVLRAAVKRMGALVKAEMHTGRWWAVGIGSRVAKEKDLALPDASEGLMALLALTLVIESRSSAAGKARTLVEVWEYATAIARTGLEFVWTSNNELPWDLSIGTATMGQ